MCAAGHSGSQVTHSWTRLIRSCPDTSGQIGHPHWLSSMFASILFQNPQPWLRDVEPLL